MYAIRSEDLLRTHNVFVLESPTCSCTPITTVIWIFNSIRSASEAHLHGSSTVFSFFVWTSVMDGVTAGVGTQLFDWVCECVSVWIVCIVNESNWRFIDDFSDWLQRRAVFVFVFWSLDHLCVQHFVSFSFFFLFAESIVYILFVFLLSFSFLCTFPVFYWPSGSYWFRYIISIDRVFYFLFFLFVRLFHF